MKKHLLIVAVCALFSQATVAANLQGEFGVNLLQKVDTSNMKSQEGFGGTSAQSGPATYSFSPTSNGLGVAFDDYSFSTDASRSVIASISASKNFASEDQCKQELEKVKTSTGKTYGPANYSGNNMIHFIDDKSKVRTASISCNQNVLYFVMNDSGSNLKF